MSAWARRGIPPTDGAQGKRVVVQVIARPSCAELADMYGAEIPAISVMSFADAVARYSANNCSAFVWNNFFRSIALIGTLSVAATSLDSY